MGIQENPDNLTPEELLGPPKYDLIGVAMVFVASLIVGILVGVIILLSSYFTIGGFSIESGVSPILLALIAFFGLTIGNLILYAIMSAVFPNIYLRTRTSMMQIVSMSIILYIFFTPFYFIIASLSEDPKIILFPFSVHIILSVFTWQMLLAVLSQYRYVLLSLYAGVASLLVTSLVVFFVQSSFSGSGTSLFLLFGLTIVAYVIGMTIFSLGSLLYYLVYKATGSDILGSIYGRIEMEERKLEAELEVKLTSYKK